MILRYSVMAVMLVGVLGCASREADFTTQATQISDHTMAQLLAQLMAEPSAASSIPNDAPTYLTDLVDIPELDQYLQHALRHNPSLQQSMLALQIAYAQQGVSVSEQRPQIEASFTAQEQQASQASYTSEISISWELDLWRKLAASSAAAAKDIAASQASLQATRDLLAANIMRNWLEISLHQQLLEIEQRRLAIFENNESLILGRYRVGLENLQALDNAKTSTATTHATVVEYRENLAKSQRNLWLLTGQWNSTLSQPQVPLSFPAVINPIQRLAPQNMAGRPDLQQAFFNLEAESYRSDAAYKAMLPSFSLSASVADFGSTPSQALFTSPLWSLLGQISAPLFQGGKLKAQAEMAELTAEQAYWAYQEALLNAVNEVENAVGQENALARQQQHLSAALACAERSEQSYEQQYRAGLIDIFDLLTVQRQTYDIAAQLANTTYQRLLNRIDLGLALGLGVAS